MIDKVSELQKEIKSNNLKINLLLKSNEDTEFIATDIQQLELRNTFLNGILFERERIKEIIQNMKNAFDSKPNNNRYNIVSESCQILLNEIGEVK